MYKKILKKSLLKITPQRSAILTIIDKYGHTNIETIYKEIKLLFPSISLATIYKNINIMKEKGILLELHPMNSKILYEIKKEQHGHFVCKKCNKIFDLKIEERNCLKFLYQKDNDEIFNIENSEIFLYGICKKCSYYNDK